jgi:hypothetical protein
VHVVQGCAQTRLNFAGVTGDSISRRRASDGITGVTEWLSRLIEVIRNFLYEMVLSNYRAADNDVSAADDDVRVQAIECVIRMCNFVKESSVEDYATVYGARLASARERDSRCRRWGVLALAKRLRTLIHEALPHII